MSSAAKRTQDFRWPFIIFLFQKKTAIKKVSNKIFCYAPTGNSIIAALNELFLCLQLSKLEISIDIGFWSSSAGFKATFRIDVRHKYFRTGFVSDLLFSKPYIISTCSSTNSNVVSSKQKDLFLTLESFRGDLSIFSHLCI